MREALLSKPEHRHKPIFSPIYLAALSGILLIILIINGLLEINRAKKGFYLLLEREATVLIQHFEKNVRETLSSLQMMETASGRQDVSPFLSGFLFGLEESVAEYLVETVHRIDQIDQEKILGPDDFKRLADQYLVASIEIYDINGNLLRSGPIQSPSPAGKSVLKDLMQGRRSVVVDLFGKPLADGNWFSVAALRKKGQEILALHLKGEQMKRLFRQFGVQRAISDIGTREGILYISILDGDLRILAHSDPNLDGEREEDPFLRSSLRGDRPLSRLYPGRDGEEIFEVVKPFSQSEKPLGLIRIGYSSKEVRSLLNQIKKNVAVSILFFLALGVAAISLTWINRNRHLRRMEDMEERVRLAERLSSLGHLAAGVAHEIRNPLNAIAMGHQRLKREFLPPEESKKEEYLSFTDLIFKEIRKVNEIIEQFLSLARPFQVHLRPSSLQNLLRNLVMLLEEEASSRGVRIQANTDPETPLIQMDEEKLTQALLNIMKNGIQAMEGGGILRLETQWFKDRVEVSIVDSGSGIPPDRMDKIFNYYYTTKEKGVGLGLPIAHRIIEAHGGQLKVESRVGAGTKVKIVLPARSA
jgi:signal transduction histidine kinase